MATKVHTDTDNDLIGSPAGGTVSADIAAVKVDTAANLTRIKAGEFTPMPDWSLPQLTITIPAIAGTLTLPSVVVAALPTGATVTRARAILTSRLISNTNVAANKLNGATVAATSQVVQIKKGSGAWVDAIEFIDDQFSQAGSVSEGGVFLPGTVNLSSTITGNDTYSFQWLLALADVASIVMQGVKICIQMSYTLP